MGGPTEFLGRLQSALSGTYHIERELGAGGMAVVFVARDERHERSVALKVLRPELAAVIGAERFLQEIRVTATLQHPHILPLFDSGEAGGFLYYVMPYVEGESLRERLSRERQLPVDEAVRIASEVADALDYAHRHRVIHRDIKPENILLEDGHALVADFGIALAVRAAGGARLTETGLSLGTPQYMSPEQASADRELDARSDLYSLGCVLYEMLVGEPPHTGPTVQAVVAKLLTDRPRLVTELRHSVPSPVVVALHRALEKLPADRFATAGEFRRALNAPGPVGSVTPAAGGTARLPGRRRLVAGLVAAVLIGICLTAGYLAGRRAHAASTEVRYWNIALPDTAPIAFVGSAPLGVGRTSLAITHDGRAVVYVAARGSGSVLGVRRLDRDSVQLLPGTEGAYSPLLSPDDQWVAFFVGNELRKAPLSGGPPVTLAQVTEPYASAWARDGRILVAEVLGMRLSWIPEAGGRPEPLRAQPQARVSTLQLLGGDWALISSNRVMGLLSLATGEFLVVTRNGLVPSQQARVNDVLLGSYPRFVPTGHIVYLSSGGPGALMALPFDLAKRRVLGPPFAVLEGVRQEAEWGAGQFDLSPTGDFVYAPGPNAAIGNLVWLEPGGRLDTVPAPRRDYGTFRVSPDGRRILALVWPPADWPALWVIDLTRGVSSPLPGGAIADVSFDWSPDGQTVLFPLRRDTLGQTPLLLRQGPASAAPRDTLPVGGRLYAKLAPDGRHVALYERDRQGILLGVLGDTTARLLEAEAAFPSFSPDGQWVAFTSRASGQSQVVVASVSRPAERYPISDRGGEEPIWLRSGREIVYRNSRRWMAVDVVPARGALRFGPPRLLFEGRYHNVPGLSHDVSPDGRRHLLLLGPGAQQADHLNVITNFFAELRRTAPGRRD